MQSAEESVATATRTPPAPRKTNTNTSTPATTLLLRLQTCTILQDLRDTLQELLNCIDLPLIIGPSEFASLVEFLRAYAQDDMLIVETTLHILVNLTDISNYPGSEQAHKTENSTPKYHNNEQNGHNSRDDARRNSADYSALTVNEKRRICDSFTRVLVKHATLLLNFVKRGQHTTQSRLYAIQLLTRLEEFDAAQMHKVLLASHGASVLVDVLVEESNDVFLLQRSVLFLLRSMTMIDTELQTLLAFDNAFEALAQFIDVVGGVNGGEVAVECLGIMHNMLRSNKATQKYFREMEYARLLTPLFISVHEELMSKIKSATITTSTINSSPSSSSQQQQQSLSLVNADFSGKLPLHESMNLIQYGKETSTVLLLAMAIFSCLLRESEANQDEYMLTQSNLLECEVLEQLVYLALCGVVADDATRIEALRTITLLIKGHKSAITSFVEMENVITMARSTAPNIVMQWTSLRALMHYLFTSYDIILLTTTAQLMEAVCTRHECQPRVVDVLLNGFSPDAGTMLCNTLDVAASEIPSAITHMRSQYMNDYGKWLANTQLARCGEVFAWTLFNRMPSSELLNSLQNNSSSLVTHGKYFAVQLLRELLRMPFMASSLTLLPWENLESSRTSKNTFSVENTITAQPAEQSNFNTKQESKNNSCSTTTNTTNITVNTNGNNSGSFGEEGTFFHAFASYVVQCLRGEHVQQGMDGATLGAYVETLLIWLKESDKAVNILVHSRDGLYTKLLECARESNAAQLRLYCAVIAAVVCVQFTQITKKSSHKEDNIELEYVVNNVKEGVNNENVSNVMLTTNVMKLMEDKSVLHNDNKSVVKQPEIQHLKEEKSVYSDLYHQFISYLGGPAFFDSVLFDINASNSQWAHPAPSAFLIVAHVTYNVEFVELINQVIEDFRALHQELLQMRETTTTRRNSGDEEHNTNTQQENTRVSNQFIENVETGEQSIMSRQNYNALQEGQKHGKEKEEVEVSRETRLQQAEQFVDRDANWKSASSKDDVEELQEQIIKLQQKIYSQASELKLLHDENERLQSELAEMHMRYTELVRELETERTNYKVTETEKEQHESASPEATITTSAENNNTKCTLSEETSTEMLIKEVETLRESVHLLEETVNSNEDERQHLLRTIEMMEEQLRSKPEEVAAAVNKNEIIAPEVLYKTPLETNTLSVQTEMESKDREVNCINSNEIALCERINEMQVIIHALETERDELLCVLGEICEVRPVAPATECSKLQTLTSIISNNNNNNNNNDNNSDNIISKEEHEQGNDNMEANQNLPQQAHNNNDKNIADVNYNKLMPEVDNDDSSYNGSSSNKERLHEEHPVDDTVLENKEVKLIEETGNALYFKEHQIPVQSAKLSAEALEHYTVYNSGECNLQNDNQQNNLNSNTNYVGMNVDEDVENVFDDHTLQTDENPFADEDDGFGGNIASIDDTDFMSQLHEKIDENDLRERKL